MLKKISAMLLSVIMTAAILTSCGSGDSSSSSSTSSAASSEASSSADASAADSSADASSSVPDPSFTIDDKDIATDDLIICTIDGKDIDFATFRYYYYYTISLYTKNYGVTLDEIASTEGGFESLMNDTITQLKWEYATLKLAEDNGITLDDDDNKQIEEYISNAKSQCATDEEFQQTLKDSYMTEDMFKNMLELSQLYQKVTDTLFTNGGKYATSKEDFLKIVQDTDEYARVVHVLIPYQCQAEITDEDTKSSYDSMSLDDKLSAKKTAFYALSDDEQTKLKESAKQLAEQVLEKAENGDDFSELIKEYGWDPGMESSPDGYYINTNTNFVDEYMDAAYKLKENEISGLVESDSYGWFIIKRLPVDMDYVNEHIDDLISDYDSPKVNQVYNETIKDMTVEYGEYYDKITSDSIK